MLKRRAAASLPQAVIETASEWFVRLGADDAGPTERTQWQAWLQANPLHRQAWERIETLGRQFEPIEPRAGLAALDAPRSRGRRKALKTLSLALLAGGAALAARQLPWQSWRADLRTATGEIRRLALADGSILTLDTDSAVDVVFDEGLRRLALRRGSIHIETHRDPAPRARPFVVDTPAGRATALGTRYVVSLAPEGARIAVEQGAVRLEPRGGAAAVVVPAGMAAELHADGATAPASADPREHGWVEGVLYADGMRLGDLVAALDRYRPGRLACDPAVSGLRISGAYPLDDTDRALTAIERVLPVRVERLTRYWVTVKAR